MNTQPYTMSTTIRTPFPDELAREREKFRSIQQIARAVGSTLDLNQLLHLIVGKITELMDADRSTLYVIDAQLGELWTKVLQADELKEIRLKIGEGIAGWVAKSGELVNIPDAYADSRFSPETDQRSGYRTRSILCVPMRNSAGEIIGVVQVLNKRGSDGVFTQEDEELLAALVSQASIAIENSQLYLSVVRNNRELQETQHSLERRMRDLDLLLDIEKQVNEAASLDEMFENLLGRAAEVAGAEAAFVLLRETNANPLLYLSTFSDRHSGVVKQMALKQSVPIQSWIVEEGRGEIVGEDQIGTHHTKDIVEQMGILLRSLVRVPVVSGDQTFGSMGLINKRSRENFDDDDLRLLTLIAARTAQAVNLARVKDQRVKEGRLASIGQMLSGVLHDLKTPMTIISGYAQLMAGCDEEKTRQEYVDHILKQFDVLAAMTKEILDFAKGESHVLFRKVFVHKFMNEIREHLLHEFAGRNIALTIDNQYKGAALLDETKFRRVIHNIARNAAQAMVNGGKFHIATMADDQFLSFTFQDSGPGIPEELEGRLFELFATARKKDGSGLGLAIVKKIVDEHSGTISYRSKPGKGTTFEIRLPLRREGSMAHAVVLDSI